MNDQKRFTFTKNERVTSERQIEKLFTGGQAFMAYPFRVVFTVRDCSPGDNSNASKLSVLISVPKKRIRSAVKRNKIKRLVREAYRLNKHLFQPERLHADHYVDVAFIYVKDEAADFALIEKGVQKALQEMFSHLESRKDL